MSDGVVRSSEKGAQTPVGGFCASLWPSTQGHLARDIYEDLVAYLYACRSSVIGGALGGLVMFTFIAWSENIPGLTGLLLLAYIPVNLLRVVHVEHYRRLKPAERNRDAELHEARYGIITVGNSALMGIMSALIMFAGSIEAKLAITCVILGIATGSAGRNACMPRIVSGQTSVMLIPIIIGLALSGNSTGWVLSFLIFLFFGSMQNIAARIRVDTIGARQEARRADQMARFDPLTGLPNRIEFDRVLGAAIAEGRLPSVLYIDLDRFKKINDTQGHPSGDALLRQVAHRIASLLPGDGAMLARFGGDEFVVMAMDRPAELADRIVNACHEPFLLATGSALIGASIGIALHEPGITGVDLVKRADLALYRAKDGGRDRAVVFHASMEQHSAQHALIEDRLRNALKNDLIEVHFQPIVHMGSNTIAAAEALVRWKDPTLGQVRPDIFIAMAENVGLIDTLGEHVLLKACKAASYWDDQIAVAVNISAMQFREPARLKAAVMNALSVSGLPGHRLELEITESTMIEDFDTVRETLLALKMIGVRIALDDFGTGYTSISYLDRIPFDKVKIDRSMVLAAMDKDAASIAVKMIAQIARAQNASVVVEGIETEGQALKMVRLGCGYAQGFLFGRPSDDQSRYITPALVLRSA
jgi:diguanylate cyclase (GGDEF)-like protein